MHVLFHKFSSKEIFKKKQQFHNFSTSNFQKQPVYKGRTKRSLHLARTQNFPKN